MIMLLKSLLQTALCIQTTGLVCDTNNLLSKCLTIINYYVCLMNSAFRLKKAPLHLTLLWVLLGL